MIACEIQPCWFWKIRHTFSNLWQSFFFPFEVLPTFRKSLTSVLFIFFVQCAYNSAKAKNKFHFWGSQWSHGDTLLFSLASAQVGFRVETVVFAFQIIPCLSNRPLELCWQPIPSELRSGLSADYVRLCYASRDPSRILL